MFLMLDIETMGTEPESVILSIGAVCFNNEGIFRKKEWVLDTKIQKAKGRTECIDCLSWWKEQSREARHVFEQCEKYGMHPFDWIEEFHEWLKEASESVGEKFEGNNNIKAMGNGADFDIVLVSHLITMFAGKSYIPWKFWNVLCFRTFNFIFKLKDKHPRTGLHHNALDDANYQAEAMMLFLNRGKKK